MKVSDLKEKCVTCEMISCNYDNGFNQPATSYLTIFELLDMIQSSGGVISVDSFGNIHNNSFPLLEIFKGDTLVIFTYHITTTTNLKTYFVLAKTYEEVRRLFKKWVNIPHIIIDYEALFIVPKFDSCIPFIQSKLPLKYVNFELLGVKEELISSPIPSNFTSSIVPISYLIIRSITYPIIIDGIGICYEPEILNIIDDDDYKDKSVYIVAIKNTISELGGKWCAITDDIERLVDDLKKERISVYYYWKVNVVDISNVRRI